MVKLKAPNSQPSSNSSSHHNNSDSIRSSGDTRQPQNPRAPTNNFKICLEKHHSVGTMIPLVESETCYQIHPEILCDQGHVEPKCLPFCKQKFGPKAGGQCIDQPGSESPFCACDYPC
ncbi:hypothetical protein AABB24_027567 [Solanum stoloniferum]|uniref:Uncharacterized protein n=1 Tax=Solanum stoloniferum TaxID=62892 RepID=A0ABD2S3W7_9SOLN